MAERAWNVLVFPGGTEIGLEIQKALSWRKEVKLFSVSEGVSNHAPFVFRNYFEIPNVHNPAFVDSLNEVIEREQIDFVIPAHDDVIVALAANQEQLRASVVTSPLETCLICRSKSATYSALRDILPVPQVFPDASAVHDFPVFVKPDKGQGSQNAVVVKSSAGLEYALNECKEPIILEYMPGEEFTVDCFSDRRRGLLFCRGRKRIRVRNGISFNSRPVEDAVFQDYGKRISGKLEFHGSWFFQLKKDSEGAFKLLEVAPRIAGTMAMYRVLGINFPLLSLYEQARIPIEIVLNDACVEIDRAIVNRYKHNLSFDAVYVDLDDTLVVNDVVNVELVKFLYQCINEKKTIILLTKHEGDVTGKLGLHRLAGVFDEVIQIDRSLAKSDYISRTNAILIDDSFSERRDAAKNLGIPTFDSSMIEMLIDDRV